MSDRNNADVFKREQSQHTVDAQQFANKVGTQHVNNIMKDDFGIDIPTELAPLPSGGVCYPAGSALHQAKVVEISPMTAREEDILTSRALIKQGKVISRLISSCLVDKNVDVDKMISGDRNAVMTAIRITGYGASYDIEVDCPACAKRSPQSFDLAGLPLKFLKIDPIVDGSNVFKFELPVSKQTVHFKFLTGQDELDMFVESERRKKSGMKQNNSITMRLTYQLLKVGNIEEKHKIDHFIQRMPARDSLALRKFIDDNEPGIDMKGYMECNHCDEESEVRLPMGAAFFWPDA